jgi:hypothetical protein
MACVSQAWGARLEKVAALQRFCIIIPAVSGAALTDRGNGEKLVRYDKLDLQAVARNARNYLSTMVDDAHDHLPYWFIAINEAPAYACHVRVDLNGPRRSTDEAQRERPRKRGCTTGRRTGSPDESPLVIPSPCR